MYAKQQIFYLLLIFYSGLYPANQISAQNFDTEYHVKYTGIASTGEFAPFWFHSKNYGRLSEQPFSSNLELSAFRDISLSKKNLDIGFGADLDLRTSFSNSTDLFIQQLYLQGRWKIFDLMIGIKEEKNGFQNYPLSMGGIVFSENARPFPKITAGIERFTFVPYTFNMLEFKGAITHGWFADNIYGSGIMMHHKYLHLKLGGNLPVRLSTGLDHVAQWGGKIPETGETKFSLENFKTIFMGRSGGVDSNPGEQVNVLGNHIISQYLKAEVDIKQFKINAYWETITEDPPFRIFQWLANTRRDGLWGISVRNKDLPFVQGLVYEFLSTVDQSGPWHDKDGVVYGGMDNYLYNFLYHNGWTHFGRTIGTPMIISPVLVKNGPVNIQFNFVQSHHLGLEGKISDFKYRFLGTFSNYYINNFPPAIPNFSWMLEVNKSFSKLDNMEFSISIGGDKGAMTGNSTGLLFSVRKSGILFPK